MTELERLLKAKIPGERTGIEIKHSLCAICSPGHHCGLDCYVKDGVILKVEGTPDHPYNHGKICSKGVNNRQYVYRADRIRTPLRRVGERGEGKFEPVSWEEAYKIIGEKLNAVKAPVWAAGGRVFQRLLQMVPPAVPPVRLFVRLDQLRHRRQHLQPGERRRRHGHKRRARRSRHRPRQHLPWMGVQRLLFEPSFHSGVRALKERGGKVIIVDPRITPAVKNLADIHLQINPGTDGALALGMAKIIIENGWADHGLHQKIYAWLRAVRTVCQAVRP